MKPMLPVLFAIFMIVSLGSFAEARRRVSIGDENREKESAVEATGEDDGVRNSGWPGMGFGSSGKENARGGTISGIRGSMSGSMGGGMGGMEPYGAIRGTGDRPDGTYGSMGGMGGFGTRKGSMGPMTGIGGQRMPPRRPSNGFMDGREN